MHILHDLTSAVESGVRTLGEQIHKLAGVLDHADECDRRADWRSAVTSLTETALLADERFGELKVSGDPIAAGFAARWLLIRRNLADLTLYADETLCR